MKTVTELEASFKKARLPLVRSGDTVRVHQRISEGAKTRVQVFEGLIIRVKRANSLTAAITVRRIASGIGVEKDIMMHAPSITKIEVIKRGRVRRNYLSYMRQRHGKSARLTDKAFSSDEVNVPGEETIAEAEAEQAAAPLAEPVAAEPTETVEADTKDEEPAKPAEQASEAEPKPDKQKKAQEPKSDEAEEA